MRRPTARSATCSCSSAPSPTPTGSPARASSSTSAASSCTGPEARAGCLPLETSRPGVFAVGDVRAGSVKRVAAAVGDGAQVVAALHTYLADAPALADQPGAMAPEPVSQATS